MKTSILLTLSALISLTLCPFGVAGEVRIWTDSTGKHKTEAEFVSMEDDIVTLRKPGTDKVVKLPLDRLSDADQEYVDDLVRELEREAEKKKPAEPRVVTEAGPAPPATREPRTPTPRRPANNVINSVRGAVYRTQTMNNMKQIALALIQYESAKGRYPTAATMTADGQPGLSWRVSILPMIEENGLYRQFKLNEPWDSDHNKALIARMPQVFQSPGSDLDAGYTNYLAVVAPDTVIASGSKAARMRDVADGTSRTIMFVEADDNYAAIWTKPDDYDWDRTNPGYGLGGIWTGIFFAGFGDGSIKNVDAGTSADELNAYFSRNGGD